VIINQQFVTMHFPGVNPLGQRIRLIDAMAARVYDPSPTAVAMIVGIAPTARQRNFQDFDPDPVAYLPYQSDPQRYVMLLVRAPGDPSGITAIVRDQMRMVEPDLPLFSILTMDGPLAQQRWPLKLFGSMLAIFGAIALVLSAVGLYAVTRAPCHREHQRSGYAWRWARSGSRCYGWS
jgi:putative ABC transport system permease protein